MIMKKKLFENVHKIIKDFFYYDKLKLYNYLLYINKFLLILN